VNSDQAGSAVDVAALLRQLTPQSGWLVLPALAEPHAHLDKAFLAERVENATGDLMGAIEAMMAYGPTITFDDIVERGERAARLLLSNGCTAIRTHADLVSHEGLKNVEAMIEVRERLRGLLDIQVSVLCGWPSTGAAGAPQLALLRDAVAAGVDVVGGCPHLEDDPVEATESFLTIAGEAGLPVDLHTDETLDPGKLFLDHLAKRVIELEFPFGVTASHCCSLGVQSEHVQRRVAELVADARIHVVALPHTNLFLQGRDHQGAMPRGLTAVKALRDAGVNVCAGGDNLQDPFNPVGRGDPLETAGLMIMTAHLLPDDALHSVSAASRLAMGMVPTDPAAGDFVAVRAATVREAIAFGPPQRIVVRHGRLVSGELPAGSTETTTRSEGRES
jgi:cytosine deaminase